EAFEAGAYAVQLVEEGGGSAALQYDGQKTVFRKVPLDAVAGKTRQMPEDFLKAEENDLAEPGLAYLRRLVPNKYKLGKPFVWEHVNTGLVQQGRRRRDNDNVDRAFRQHLCPRQYLASAGARRRSSGRYRHGPFAACRRDRHAAWQAPDRCGYPYPSRSCRLAA